MLSGAILLCAATFAVALDSDPPIGTDEARCQDGVSKTLGKFMWSKAKCMTKCDSITPQDPDCLPPYGGTTISCLESAEEKMAKKMHRRCRDAENAGKDACPECYGGTAGTCETFVQDELSTVAALVDAQLTLLLCDDSASIDNLSADEVDCRDRVAKRLAKHAAGIGNCLRKCRRSEIEGETDGSCAADDCASSGFPSAGCNTKTKKCVNRLTEKGYIKVIRSCPDKPDCLPEPIEAFVAPFANLAGDVDDDAFCYP